MRLEIYLSMCGHWRWQVTAHDGAIHTGGYYPAYAEAAGAAAIHMQKALTSARCSRHRNGAGYPDCGASPYGPAAKGVFTKGISIDGTAKMGDISSQTLCRRSLWRTR